MKKLIAIILAILIVIAVMIPILSVSATDNASFVVGNASGEVGKNVDVTVSIKNNPGITALQVKIDYSANELELVSVKDEGLFNDAISNSKLTNNPFKISWYSQGSIDESDSGVLATLTFKILKDFDESKINISYDADNVFDIKFDNVNFETKSGVVTIASEVETTVTEPSESVIPTDKTEPTTATKPSEPITPTNDATFVVGNACGKVGENVDVTVSICNNPGITALQVMIDYSSEELKLVSVNDEGLFNNAISNSNLSSNPLKISWYSQDSIDESYSGVLATLTFKILKDFDESKINISYNADNVFDINFNNVSFKTQNGVVSVESEVGTTVTEPSESVIPTEKTEPTADIEPSSSVTEPSSSVTEQSSDNTGPSSTEATEPSSGTTELDRPFLLGDANLDTVVNVKDATTVQKYVASLIDLSDEAKLCADFDQNEKINVKDATGIQKRVAGII